MNANSVNVGINARVIDPGTFQPCPAPVYKTTEKFREKTLTLESKEIIPTNDMFTAMNECLSEVNKLISKAVHINEQVPLCLKK